MEKISKKMLSLLLSVVMIATMIPSFAVVAQATAPQVSTEWTEIASTDFTKTTSWSSSRSGLSQFYSQSGNVYKSNNNSESDNAWWAGWQYNTDGTTFEYDSTYGVKVRDGFLYTTGWNKNGTSQSNTPVTGKSAFKIDVEFSFYGDYSLNSEWKNNTFIKLKTDNYNSESKPWENNWFSQCGYGSMYKSGDSENSPTIQRTSSTAGLKTNYFKIASDNALIGKNNLRHYVLEYTHGTIRTYITDGSGNVLINFGSVDNSTATSAIKGIQIGACTGDHSYYQFLAYKNVTFYEGSESTYSPEKENSNDKYLYAYFTGNSDAGEKLRYAVSSDGYNWESLNGANAVADAHAIAGSLSVYPAGGRTGLAATGNVRDPYILYAQDGTYYVLATDLDTDTYGFDNNCKLLVWHVNSLVDIDSATPWVIDCTSLLEGEMGDDCELKRAWAPEAVYDYEEGKYMLFFAAKDSNNTYGTRMYYVYTSDFKTFDGDAKLLLPHVTGNNIDANITYADGLYYMWYKDETNSKIGYATAEHANGPYGTVHPFYDDRVSSVFEGPEVYYNTQAGKYILIADNFGGGSYMAAYQSDTVDGFSASNKLLDGTAYNMTHMYPRHGFITRISTSDYNALIAKYGRDVCFNSNVPSGHKAKEYLIARYFTTPDSTADASGHNNNLDSSNAVMGSYHDRYAADFSGNKVAYKAIASMLSTEGVNAKDGITFDWYGYSTADDHGRFFDMASVDRGTVVWDGSGNNQKNSNYIYCSQGIEFGSYYGNGSGRSGGSRTYTDTNNEWHRYTMVLSNGWLEFYVDGELYGWTVGFNNGSGAVISGRTPYSIGDGFNDTVLSSMVNLFFGDSAYRDDEDFLGAISDFRIFKRALTFEDVESADSVVSTGSYLTDEASFNDMISSGLITKEGAVTWDDTENAAYFNGGYLVVNENPLDTTTNLTGFTISFDFKRTSANELWSRFLDINDGTTNNTFAINAGSDSDQAWHRMLTLTKVNGTESKYFASDTNSSTYCSSPGSSKITDDSDLTDTWHNYTVVMDASGYYSVYLDGVLRGVYRNDYNSTDLGNGVTPSSIKNQMVVMTQVNLGKAIYNDPTFKGYMKNVHFVSQDVGTDISLNAKTEDVMTFVKAKMNTNINQYKNISDLYQAYYNACEAIDAAKYGDDSAKLESSRADLISAVNGMTTWNLPEYTGKSYGYTSSNRVYENDSRDGLSNYVKLAYCQTGITASTKAGYIDITSSNNYYWGGDAYSPEVTMIYDGYSTKPQSTVLLSLGGTKGKTRYVIGATIEDSNGLVLTDNWHGSESGGIGNLDFNWGWDTRPTYLGNNTGQTSEGYLGKGQNLCLAWNNGSRYIRFVNQLRFDGSMAANEAYRAITPSYHIYMNGSDSYRADIDPVSRVIPTTTNIRVINYKRIEDNAKSAATSKKLNTAADIDDFKEGNAQSLFTTFETLTSWNGTMVNSYFTSSNNWNGLQSAIASDITAMSNASATKDTRTAAYQNLRETITSKRTIGGNTYSILDAYQNGTDSVGFTTTSYNNFKTAYLNAKNMFAALDNNDSQSGYAQNSLETLTGLNTALSNAFANLELKADFRALDAAKAAWLTFANSSEVTSAYTTSSVQALKDYVNSTTEFPLENTADRDDTGTSQNSAIAAEIAKYTAFDSASILDKLADLNYFDAEFDKANTFLVNLDGKTAEYTKASVQAVVTAVTAAAIAESSNKSVQTIANANAAARADYGQLVQTDANGFADNIKTAMDGLKKVETVVEEGVDTSAFNAAVAILNNVDPDAYDVTEGDVASIRRSANATITAKADQITYSAATINVLKDGITQTNLDDATHTITDSLTVRTKTYAITKDEEGSTDFSITAQNGTYEDGYASYGTTIVADSKDEETAWYLEIRTGSMHKELAFQNYGRRLKTKVLGTTKIKAVKKVTGQKRVKILRKYDDVAVGDRSPVQLVDYVDSGSTFTLPAAPAIAFNSFDGYYIGETKYNAGATVTISADTDIIARYTTNESANCAINVLSDSTQNTTVAYNTRVSLTGESDTYGWVEAIDASHFRPFKIGKDLEFFASESTELKAVTKSEFDAYNFTLPSVNLRKEGIIDNGTKKVFNAQLVNDGYDIQEYGILIAAPLTKEGSTPISIDNLLPSMVIIENSGKHEGENAYQILRAKSTKLVGANQFTISVSSLPSEYIYRGYAIYKDAKGNLQTVYSEAMR